MKKKEAIHRKPTIAELEALLELEESFDEDDIIVILPNGQIQGAEGVDFEALGKRKPITMRENLGGEYALNA